MNANTSDTQHPITIQPILSMSQDVGFPEPLPSTSRQSPVPFYPWDSSDRLILQALTTSGQPCLQQAPGSGLPVNPRSVHAELHRTYFSDVEMASRVTEDGNMVTTSVAILKQILACVRCIYYRGNIEHTVLSSSHSNAIQVTCLQCHEDLMFHPTRSGSYMVTNWETKPRPCRCMRLS